MFWFKKRDVIYADAYTNDSLVYKYFQIREGGFFHEESSRLYENSFVSPLWNDLEINLEGDDDESFSYRFDRYDLFSFHEYNLEGFFRPDFLYFRFPPAWQITTSEPLNWLIVPALQSQGKFASKVMMPPMTRNFLFNHNTDWEFMVENKKQIINFEANTPLVHLVPLTDKKVVFRSHYDNQAVFNLQRESDAIRFMNSEYLKSKLHERYYG